MGVLERFTLRTMILVEPARETRGVVATWQTAMCRRLEPSRRRGVVRVHDSYEALIADPDLDYIFIVLPNSLHGVDPLRLPKHVLYEKLFMANAAEAREIAGTDRRDQTES